MPNGAKLTPSREMEDALMYLPRKGVTDFRKGQIIFDEHQPSKGLHLVVQGRVKVTIPLDDGTQTVVDIFTTDDFFGESSLLGASQYSERALALDNVTLMSWSSSEIEEQVERQPRLGIALLQMLVKRGLDYEERLQSFALDKTPERVVRSLLRFADRLGPAPRTARSRSRRSPTRYFGVRRDLARNRHVPDEPSAAEGPAPLLAQRDPGLYRRPPRASRGEHRPACPVAAARRREDSHRRRPHLLTSGRVPMLPKFSLGTLPRLA